LEIFLLRKQRRARKQAVAPQGTACLRARRCTDPAP